MYNCDGVRRLEVDITMCSISYVRKTKNLQTSTFEDLRFEDPQTRILVWNLCELSDPGLPRFLDSVIFASVEAIITLVSPGLSGQFDMIQITKRALHSVLFLWVIYLQRLSCADFLCFFLSDKPSAGAPASRTVIWILCQALIFIIGSASACSASSLIKVAITHHIFHDTFRVRYTILLFRKVELLH